MAQKFAITPMTLTIGTITLSFGYNPADVSQCIVLATATGAQATQRSVYIERNGTQIVQADGNASTTDQANVGAAIRDATLTPGA